jgi:hypothetical protein
MGDPRDGTAAIPAQAYGAACVALVDATNVVLETANRAVGARNMAEARPQHEISIRNFTTVAEGLEREFVPLYKCWLQACARARDSAAALLAAPSAVDPELTLLASVPDDVYGQAGVAFHILRADFGATPAGFLDGLQEANAAIQADVFSYSEDGFQGHIYTPPAAAVPGTRDCPWCAEVIKAAAVVCRFCGRDVEASTSRAEARTA